MRDIFTFKVNGNYFGIDTQYIDSITATFTKTEVPSVSNNIKEMISYRDNIIPVVSLSNYLFKTNLDNTEQDLLVICNAACSKIAFEIDNVDNILKIEDDEIHKNTPLISNRAHMINGFIQMKDKSILSILDLNKILEDL